VHDEIFDVAVYGPIRSAFGSGIGANVPIGMTRKHSGIAANPATFDPSFPSTHFPRPFKSDGWHDVGHQWGSSRNHRIEEP
jgi:hypothetical protein